MLPFLKSKQNQSGVITTTRKPDEVPKEDQDDSGDGMKACAEDILRAISSKDSDHLAEALHAAFQIFDAAPHKEADHESDGSYEDQNEKASDE